MAVLLKTLRDELRRAAEGILPEAAVYLCLSSELPSELRKRGSLAFSGKNLDIAVKTHLPEWRGRGVAIVVDDTEFVDYLGEWFAARPMANKERLLRAEFATIVAHELSHVVSEKWIPAPGEPPPVETREIQRREEVSAWAAVALPARDANPWPWCGHGAPFLRLLFHVAYRLRREMRWSFDVRFDHELYRLSPSRRYQSAIGDEPERLAHLPLTAIDDTPPPERFRELWQGDLRKWWLELSPPTEFQTTIMLRALEPFTPKRSRYVFATI